MTDSASLKKSPTAFRTIGEVAAELGLPQHVLRFWETKFSHIKPHKRRGGHRYYRPQDVDALNEVRTLLYDKGFTIKGAQQFLSQRNRSSKRKDQSDLFASGEKELETKVSESAEKHLTQDQVKRLQSAYNELIELKDILNSNA